MFMFKTNQPIKVIHLQKLANQSILNGPFVIEIVCNFFSESKKDFIKRSFNKVRELKKQIRYAMKNIFPLDFIKYISYSEVQKDSKVVNV